MELTTILTPVAQSQKNLVLDTQLAGTAKTASRWLHNFEHQLEYRPFNTRQTQKLLLPILADFDKSHRKKLNRLMQKV